MTSHERAYKFRFYPDANTGKGIIESMRKNDYHTISASNDKHVKPMHAERKPQNEPDTPFITERMKYMIIILNTLIAIILSTVFNANILILAYLTVSDITLIGYIMGYIMHK